MTARSPFLGVDPHELTASSERQRSSGRVSAMTVDELVMRLQNLRLDKADGRVKPYKPVLFTAVLVLIRKGKIGTAEILLDGALKSVFAQLMGALFPNWASQADPRYPFRHLENDGVWTLVARDGQEHRLLAQRLAGGKARKILESVVCARMVGDVFAELVRSPDGWMRAMDATVAHLPSGARETVLNIIGSNARTDTVSPTPSGTLTERSLEEHLERSWRRTPFFTNEGVELASRAIQGLPGRQVLTPVNSIDLLGFQQRENRWWVIELKRGRTSDAAVGQVSRYLGWISDMHCRGGQTAVGAIVTDSADTKLRLAVKANPRLSLWTYDDELELSRVG